MVTTYGENMSKKNESTQKPADKLCDIWAIRPCDFYKDEYNDCTSIKARFHQYFIYGKNIDCSQWQTDYKNCVRYQESNGNDIEFGAAVIKSEEERRNARLKAHYGNDTWKKRAQPPEDWAKPLPEWFAKRNQNTYLEIKQMELDGRVETKEPEKSYCLIM